MNGKELKEAMRAGRNVYGTAVVSTSPHWPGMIARSGVDFVFLDTEHIPLDRVELSWMCQTFTALGVAPIVRIPEPEPYGACVAQDAGAAGIVAPYMETLEQVRDLRGAVKLRPLKGRRLNDHLAGRALLEDDLLENIRKRNESKLLIINIESVPALAALDQILAEPDIDVLLVGPHDLSFNLGVPEQWDHPKFQGAIETIIKKGRAAGVGVGIHFSWKIEYELKWAQLGANFLLHSSDISLVERSLLEDFALFRKTLGETEGAGARGRGEGVVI